MSRKQGFDRRQFLAGTAAATTLAIIPRHVLGAPGEPSANNKLNIAGVGVGGMGSHDIRTAATENVVAICDVGANHAANAAKLFPDAKVYSDFRKMLDAQKDIDAVMVATPDHNHAVVTMAALKRGKHVFCQKPLAHSVHEALEVAKAAKETPAVPPNLDWDLWLGPSPERPFHPCYHPFAWRGWWDFGTGVLGDIGCHNLSASVKALKLGWPTSGGDA